MDKETLAKVLSLLNPDEELAAVEYRKLHERLMRFFEWNNVEDPGVLADEAIDRLGKRALEADLERGIRNASAFVLGVSRHLVQEERRRQAKGAEVKRIWTAVTTMESESSESERIDEALQHCLADLKPDRRRLIQAYYGLSGADKVKAHKKLAEENGLSLNALRNRALRVRKDLEVSIRNYLENQSG